MAHIKFVFDCGMMMVSGFVDLEIETGKYIIWYNYIVAVKIVRSSMELDIEWLWIPKQ